MVICSKCDIPKRTGAAEIFVICLFDRGVMPAVIMRGGNKVSYRFWEFYIDVDVGEVVHKACKYHRAKESCARKAHEIKYECIK